MLRLKFPRAQSAVGTSRAHNWFWSHDQPFARSHMVDFVRSDAGGFLTGSMIAMRFVAGGSIKLNTAGDRSSFVLSRGACTGLPSFQQRK